ncbi:hypothetical protein Ancab_007750 [Ancistrocladus abbreviatus]
MVLGMLGIDGLEAKGGVIDLVVDEKADNLVIEVGVGRSNSSNNKSGNSGSNYSGCGNSNKGGTMGSNGGGLIAMVA